MPFLYTFEAPNGRGGHGIEDTGNPVRGRLPGAGGRKSFSEVVRTFPSGVHYIVKGIRQSLK